MNGNPVVWIMSPAGLWFCRRLQHAWAAASAPGLSRKSHAPWGSRLLMDSSGSAISATAASMFMIRQRQFYRRPKDIFNIPLQFDGLWACCCGWRNVFHRRYYRRGAWHLRRDFLAVARRFQLLPAAKYDRLRDWLAADEKLVDHAN